MLTALKARYVFPVCGPPVEDGVVVVDGPCIREVGRDVPPNARTVDFNELNHLSSGGVAILPGLINAHTHLEFSDLAQPLGRRGMPFVDWIRAVIERRRIAASAVSPRGAIALGLDEAVRSGSTAIGDIASFPPPQGGYEAALPRVTVFREWLGHSAAQIDAARRGAVELRDFRSQNEPPWTPGLSPHAPYSTHWRIVESLSRLAAPDMPLAMHLAESREELELLAAHAGPFRTLLDDLAVWNADGVPRGARALDYLKLLAEAPRALVIHGNYLDDAEIAFVAVRARRMSIVYCPRTHAYFQHEPYRLAQMLAAGANVALGTDSRASNPDLSLLAEIRHVARHHAAIAPAAILQMATLNGACAMGLHDRVGTLEAGKRADLAVVALPDEESGDPHDLLLHAHLPNMATHCRGHIA